MCSVLAAKKAATNYLYSVAVASCFANKMNSEIHRDRVGSSYLFKQPGGRYPMLPPHPLFDWDMGTVWWRPRHKNTHPSTARAQVRRFSAQREVAQQTPTRPVLCAPPSQAQTVFSSNIVRQHCRDPVRGKTDTLVPAWAGQRGDAMAMRGRKLPGALEFCMFHITLPTIHVLPWLNLARGSCRSA